MPKTMHDIKGKSKPPLNRVFFLKLNRQRRTRSGAHILRPYFNFSKYYNPSIRVLFPKLFFLCALILIAVGIFSMSLHTFIVRASVSNLYATTCLGGWENTHLATGAPDVLETDDISTFTDSNSARLNANTHAQIYCGGFTGDILENTIPKKILVKFSWAVKYPELENEGIPVVETESVINIEESSPIEALPPTSEQVEPAPELPVSFFDSRTIYHILRSISAFFALTAYAEEVSVGEQNESAIIIDASATTTETTTGTIQDETTTPTEDTIQDETTTPTEDTIVTMTPDISSGLVEAMYTLDGVLWKSLGFVDKYEFTYTQFEIPIEEASQWANISKIQIGIRSMSLLDSIDPAIYLDSVWLEVEYKNLLEDPFPPPGSLEGDIIISTTPFENMTAVLVSRESKSILQGPRNELWLSSVSPYSDNPFMTEWRFVAEDKILSDNPRIIFSEDGLFWAGENDENVWRFNPLSGSYESVSRIPGESTELPFDDLSGEPHKLQASPQGDLEILEIIETHDKPIATE